MSTIDEVLQGVGETAATASKTAAKAGKGVAKVLQKVGAFASAHPVASSRLMGVGQVLSGYSNLKKAQESRSFLGTIAGVGQMLLGGAMVIYNDREWYEKAGAITPAFNLDRPMEPVLLTDFTKDPTIGGVGKLVDVELEWELLNDSLVINAVSNDLMKAIRYYLKSDLKYDEDKVSRYLNDAISVTIWMLQISRQLAFRDFNTSDNPTAYDLINKISETPSDYGPVNLRKLHKYAHLKGEEENGNQEYATTIELYDTLAATLQDSILLPGNVPEFLNFYFGNTYISNDTGYNAQLIFPRVREVKLWNADDSKLVTVDITELDPADLIRYIKLFNKKYSIIISDLGKAKAGRGIGFLPFSMLTPAAVYSEEFIQLLINAYTDNNSVMDGGFIRLDFLHENLDMLTTFLALSPFQDKNSPLYTPCIHVKSMVVKYQSDANLKWDFDLFQGPFNTDQDFGISICSTIKKDIFNNVQYGTSTVVGDQDGILQSPDSTPFTTVNLIMGQSNAGLIKLRSKPITKNGSPIPVESRKYSVLSYGSIAFNRQGDQEEYSLSCVYDYTTYNRVGIYLVPVAVKQAWSSTNSNEFLQSTIAYISDLSDLGDTAINIISMTKPPILYSEDRVEIPAGENIIDINVVDKNFSDALLTYLVFSTTSMRMITGIVSESLTSHSTTVGYANLDSYMADQLDFHLPMRSEVTVHTTINSTEYPEQKIGTSLIKENYIPFIYNIKDLNSILYKMFYSLFQNVYMQGNKVVDISTQNKVNNNTPNNNKNNKKHNKHNKNKGKNNEKKDKDEKGDTKK